MSGRLLEPKPASEMQGNFKAPSALEIADAPCRGPSCHGFDVANGFHHKSLFRGVTQKASGNPQWLYRIIETPLMWVCHRDAADPFYVPHDGRCRSCGESAFRPGIGSKEED
jgi:hypothetical protein